MYHGIVINSLHRMLHVWAHSQRRLSSARERRGGCEAAKAVCKRTCYARLHETSTATLSHNMYLMYIYTGQRHCHQPKKKHGRFAAKGRILSNPLFRKLFLPENGWFVHPLIDAEQHSAFKLKLADRTGTLPSLSTPYVQGLEA